MTGCVSVASTWLDQLAALRAATPEEIAATYDDEAAVADPGAHCAAGMRSAIDGFARLAAAWDESTRKIHERRVRGEEPW